MKITAEVNTVRITAYAFSLESEKVNKKMGHWCTTGQPEIRNNL